MTTPYDGKVGVIHWAGKAVGESTIEELADTLRQFGPNVKMVFVKTSDGGAWQGSFDTQRALAVDGPDSIRRWISVLDGRGLEFHAWCVLRGQDIRTESLRVVEACNIAGVRSMLLDVEDGTDYFRGGAQDARALIEAIRGQIPADFHLGLNLDARGGHPKAIFVDEWTPHVQSLHPMVYHKDFGLTPEDAVALAFRALAPFGKPIIPMLQAYNSVPPEQIIQAAGASIQQGAPAMTFFRLGTMGPREFEAVRKIPVPGGGAVPVPEADPEPAPSGAVVVRPGEEGFSNGHYDEPLAAHEAWRTFVDVHGWPVWWKPTAEADRAYVGYMPKLPAPGRYAVEVFVPSTNADTQSAFYFVTYYEDGVRQERKVALDQSLYFNEWCSLGRYDLDPSAGEQDAGRVNLTDFTIENPPKKIAAGALRWRPLEGEAAGEVAAPGCGWPIGAPEERSAARQGWPGYWQDTNGYLRPYTDSAGNQAYHTGADLNLNFPTYNLDRGAPVYAVSSGEVTWAGRLGDYWLNVIVVSHDVLPDGARFYSRYAHVQNMRVNVGGRVSRGQPLAEVGTSGGDFGNYHLHFDISPTDILRTRPGHWPGADLAAAQLHYVDPRKFIVKYIAPR